VRKTIFSNRKYILSSGREIDLSAEHIRNRVIITAMFNLLDPVQETGHSALIRLENNQTISFESLSTKNMTDESVREILKPIEGLNGSDSLLKIFEFNELISVMQQFMQKIDKELVAKK
jgi:hypothetical protein